MTVAAGDGNAENRNGNWVVSHTECPEITSGLGIGGLGSDDYNLASEYMPPAAESGSGRGFGIYGVRYGEACDKCNRIAVVCNRCGNCENHCIC